MAFVQIDRNRKTKGEVGDTVAMGLYLADGKEIKARSIVFLISRPVVAKLGWELSDKHSIRVMVHEGVGSDQGFLMLEPNEDGYTASAGNKAIETTPLRFNVTAGRLHHYTLNDTRVNTAPVQHVVDGKSLIIECPDWLRFNPLTAPAEEPAPAPEPEPEPEPVRLPPYAMPEPVAPEPQYAAFVQKKKRGRPPKGGHHYS